MKKMLSQCYRTWALKIERLKEINASYEIWPDYGKNDVLPAARWEVPSRAQSREEQPRPRQPGSQGKLHILPAQKGKGEFRN